MTPKPMKEKLIALDFIKFKNLHSMENTLERMKRQPRLGDNICKSLTGIKDFYPYAQTALKFRQQKSNHLINKQTRHQ